MVYDILSSTSVTRLKGILKNRYGMGLELSFLNDSGVVETGEGASSLKEGALQIPICSNGQLLAVAKIPDAATLSTTSHEAITEIVRLILEPALYSWYLSFQTQNQSPAFNRVGGLHIIDASNQDYTQETQASEETEFATERASVVLIVSKNPHRIPRFASQVHEIMARWAFVHWGEIRGQVSTVQDIRELGAMTILVEDLLHLSLEEKTLLNEWVATSQGASEPALILGSSMSWSEIKEIDALPTALLNEAGLRQIEADRLPSDRQFCEDAIKLLLDKEAFILNH